MKLNRMRCDLFYQKIPLKAILSTKFRFVLLFSVIFQLSTTSFAQKVIFDKTENSYKTIFKEIEEQTGLITIYNNSQIDMDQHVKISSNEAELADLYSEVLKDKGLIFEIGNEYTVIKKAPSVKENVQTIIEDKKITVKGVVTDEKGEPLPGAAIVIKGTTKGITTGFDGAYNFPDVPKDAILTCSFLGFTSKEVSVAGNATINWVLKSSVNELDDVVVVAFGTQKKESVISSITTINVSDLQSVPTSNITTALAGQMTGLISSQSTGAPGDDNAQFFIRNAASFGNNVQSPLILIDNVEVDSRQLSRLSPDDIQSFSILKDAAATALYGARGGNGVVLITTKEGKEGKAVIDLRVETSLSLPTTKVDLADPIEYMQNFNEAILTRNPTASPRYSMEKIERTQDSNRNPYAYPATNWLKELTKDYAINKRVNLSLRGGGKVATYYVGGSYSQDNGILKVDNVNKWNTNIDFKKYTLRSNVNIKVEEGTKLNVRLNGAFDDYTGPIGELGAGGRNTYYQALNADPVLFPATYAPDEAFSYAPYLLFGNSDKGQYTNPYARLMSGYEDNRASTLSAQVELLHDVDWLAKGLKFKFIGNVSRFGSFSLQRSYKPYYFTIQDGDYDQHADSQTPQHDGYELYPINPEEGSRFIEYSGGSQKVSSTMYGEMSLIYNKTFNEKHDIGGLLVGTVRDYLSGSSIGGLIASISGIESTLPKRNLSMAGRFTYAYAGKYFTEFNFGYNGSERFADGDRFGFFPSFGLGWDVSKEDWYMDLGLDSVISKFKLRGTYGLVGNDNLGGPNRFYYLSNVNLNTRNQAGHWGNDPSLGLYSKPTISITSPGNPDITWEITYKANLALELGFFDNKLSVVPEIYHERRTNILQRRSNIPSTLGLPYELYSNVQENVAKGLEVAMDYKDHIGEDLWFIVRGNFTYGTAEVKTYDEIGTEKAPWISRIGNSPSQNFGYVAEHLFVDEYEVANSASQEGFGGTVMAGDIKYVDINKDGVINQFDQVPIGHPRSPEIQYGMGGSIGYKNLDFSIFFQGQGRYSFWLNPHNMAPFMPTNGGNRAMLGWIADNHWTESNRDMYAQWPRLSNSNNMGNANNFQTSTYFMRTTSYLRLKQMEIGYTLPNTKRFDLRAYVSGSNLLTFSKFDLWDPEMGGNGLAYPLQRVFNVGLQISFK